MPALWTRLLTLFAVIALPSAAAHGSVEVADGDIQIGLQWQDEPAYAGMPNAVLVSVDRAMQHMHTAYEVPDGEQDPNVEIDVTPDAMKGYNLRIDADRFAFTPEDASTEHVPGQGHAHLYIDGQKIGRLYSEWAYLGELAPGEHTVKVSLNTNDHRAYVVDGQEVADEVAITVPAPEDDGHDHGGHDHSDHDTYDVSTRNQVPEVAIDVTPDAKKGHNLRIRTDGFRFAPEHASTDHILGEGHAHLYIDGEKIGRVYGEWMYLGTSTLPAGTHEVRVTLNGNDHRDYTVDGDVVEDRRIISVPEPSGMMHPHDPYDAPADEPQPQLSIQVTPDPKKGHNLQLTTQEFEFAPELASSDHVPGKGHAHLYIDGQKVTRLYGPWYPIMGLEPGDHTARVTLNTNAHSDYRVDNATVEDSVTFTVPEPMPMGDGHDHSHGGTIDLRSSNDAPRLDMRVEKDPKKGHNLFLDVSGFRFAPEHASNSHADGEGHAHLYIDGDKVGRLYGGAAYLGGLAPGAHTATVTLNTNDHRDIRVDGVAVAKTVTFIVPKAAGTGITGVQYTLDAAVVYGNQSVPIDLDVTDTPGVYRAVFTPAVPGDYALRLQGDLDGEPVDLDLDLDPVTAAPVVAQAAAQADAQPEPAQAVADDRTTPVAAGPSGGEVAVYVVLAMLALAGVALSVVSLVRVQRMTQ